ncbi:MAG: hypothetical protein ACPHCN_12695 [Mycobacterium sp.]
MRQRLNVIAKHLTAAVGEASKLCEEYPDNPELIALRAALGGLALPAESGSESTSPVGLTAHDVDGIVRDVLADGVDVLRVRDAAGRSTSIVFDDKNGVSIRKGE